MDTRRDEMNPETVLVNRKMLCHIVPTYNESENIRELIERTEKIVPHIPFDFRLVFVDDSSDGTADIVKEHMKEYDNIKLIKRPKPSGLGSAYMDGFKYALSRFGADYVGEMDADLQHPPETLVDMCRKASDGNFDVVLASRYVRGGGSTNWSLGRRMISKGANALSRIFLRVPVADATTGFRLISSKAVGGLLRHDVSAKGYAFQVESLYVYKKLGATFAEVPYFFGTRKAGKTKLDWKEVFRFAGTTIKTGILGVRKKERELSETPLLEASQPNVITE